MNKLSLDALVREQMARAYTTGGGRSADTVYGGHERALRQTILALTAGSTQTEHENPGEATVYVLHGRVRLAAGEASWEGRRGDLLIVPQSRHTSRRWRTPPCCSRWRSTPRPAPGSRRRSELAAGCRNGESSAGPVALGRCYRFYTNRRHLPGPPRLRPTNDGL